MGVSLQHLSGRLESRSGVSLAQWAILQSLIDTPAVSAYGLAQKVGIQPCTLTQALKRLGKKKWILIVKDPNDSRKKMLSLTRTGKDVLDQANLQMEAWFQESQIHANQELTIGKMLNCLSQIQ